MVGNPKSSATSCRSTEAVGGLGSSDSGETELHLREMGCESNGRYSEPLNDKNPEIPIIDIDISKIDLSKKRRLKSHWVLIDEKESELEYEDVYETLPESDENSIQVGEGWGPRIIARIPKETYGSYISNTTLFERYKKNKTKEEFYTKILVGV